MTRVRFLLPLDGVERLQLRCRWTSMEQTGRFNGSPAGEEAAMAKVGGVPFAITARTQLA